MEGTVPLAHSVGVQATQGSFTPVESGICPGTTRPHDPEDPLNLVKKSTQDPLKDAVTLLS